MAELERLKQLNEYGAEYSFKSTGTSVSTAAGAEQIGESDLFESVFESISTIQLSERTYPIPGMNDAKSLIRGTVKFMARDEVEANFRPPAEAGVDDLTMQQIRPETFGKTDYDITGVSADETIDIVAETSLDDDEQVIVTDLIEYNPDNIVTAVEFTVDGENKEAETLRPGIRAGDLQIYPLITPQYAKEEIRIEAKAEDAGDTELTPTGVHIAKGDLVGDLT
jgi:hypothetical protein